MLFLPPRPERKGEGGLRTKGYFKQSLSDKPLISVITVVFNGEKYLEQTIQSVLNQTYDNVEYIIIDGGSTDRTLNIIREYDHALDYWVSEPDKGIYDAMNKGIRLANGEWLYFLNSHDVFVNQTAIYSIHRILLESKYSIVVGYVNATVNDVIVGKFPTQHTICCDTRKLFKTILCHQAVFVKKSAYTKHSFDINYKYFADFKLLNNVVKDEKGYCSVNITLANFDLSGATSDWKLAVELFKESERIMKENDAGLAKIGYHLYLMKAYLYKLKMFFKSFFKK